jgi:hypothetical protein
LFFSYLSLLLFPEFPGSCLMLSFLSPKPNGNAIWTNVIL